MHIYKSFDWRQSSCCMFVHVAIALSVQLQWVHQSMYWNGTHIQGERRGSKDGRGIGWTSYGSN